MEIIHLILGKANPNRMNGVNKVVFELASRQQAGNRRVSVWGFAADTEHNYPARAFSTKLFQRKSNPFWVDPAFRLALTALPANTVFHFHGGFQPLFYSLARVLQRNGFRYVITAHGAYNRVAMEKGWLRKRIYRRFFEKRLLQRAAMIHSLGESELAGLHSFYPAARQVCIPYGFEVSPDNHPLPEYHRFIIGYCGRIDIHTKGLDVILDGFQGIKQLIPHAECWIIGDGAERTALEAQIQENNIKGVTCWGSKFGEEKWRLLQQVHVFVHPSRNEGLPASVLEALSMGIPCVLSNETNVGEVVHQYQAGVVMEQITAAAFIHSVMDMFHRFKREGWLPASRAARRAIQEAYNWETILVRFDELYQLT
jgi:glycosyltransferase involved in cell wall biosynthesis